MSWIDILLIAYFLPAIGLFVRYVQITIRVRKKWQGEEIELVVSDFISRMVGDALLWPWYVIWYGIKQFAEELK